MPHSIELAEQLVHASNQIRELQAEVERLKEDWDKQHDLRFEAIIALNKANEQVERLKEAVLRVQEDLLDIETHSVDPFKDEKWLNYINERANEALASISALNLGEKEKEKDGE